MKWVGTLLPLQMIIIILCVMSQMNGNPNNAANFAFPFLSFFQVIKQLEQKFYFGIHDTTQHPTTWGAGLTLHESNY